MADDKLDKYRKTKSRRRWRFEDQLFGIPPTPLMYAFNPHLRSIATAIAQENGRLTPNVEDRIEALNHFEDLYSISS